jgi:Flp pilus assembly protein protease CpaA
VPRPFFPDPTFAWVFVGLLIALTVVAAVYDTRTAIIPKWVSLGTLALGLVMNTIRGAIMGSNGQPLWLFDSGSPWLGAFSGFLFAVVGFLFAFVLYFVMWILRVCGGGDVKLMSALGAWVGVVGVVFLMIVSTVVLFFWMLGKILAGGLTPSKLRKTTASMPSAQRDEKSPAPVRGKHRVTFSFPAAVATVVVLLWLFRVELQLAQPRPVRPNPQGTSHVDRPAVPPA